MFIKTQFYLWFSKYTFALNIQKIFFTHNFFILHINIKAAEVKKK
jgi:hypothetical protein